MIELFLTIDSFIYSFIKFLYICLYIGNITNTCYKHPNWINLLINLVIFLLSNESNKNYRIFTKWHNNNYDIFINAKDIILLIENHHSDLALVFIESTLFWWRSLGIDHVFWKLDLFQWHITVLLSRIQYWCIQSLSTFKKTVLLPVHRMVNRKCKTRNAIQSGLFFEWKWMNVWTIG